MISKALLTKGFVALSTSSAVGTGALKFFSTKDLSARVNEELKRRFKGKTNEEVLVGAGFKINKEESSSISEVFKKRSGREDIPSSFSEKLDSFCKEGLSASFEGIDGVYKTLATVCTEEVSIENKVKRVGMTLTTGEDFKEKLELLNKKEGYRKFISDIAVKDVENLKKACEKVGEKDIFSPDVDQTILSDYMTFCVEEKPSAIKFWTGLEAVVDIEKVLKEEAKKAKEKYLLDINKEAEETKKKSIEEAVVDFEKLFKRVVNSYGTKGVNATILERMKKVFEIWRKEVSEKDMEKRFNDHNSATEKILKAPIALEKANKFWERAKIAGIVLKKDGPLVSFIKKSSDLTSLPCSSLVLSDFAKWEITGYKQAIAFCTFRSDAFYFKMKGLKEEILTESDAEILRSRWSDIFSNKYLSKQSGKVGGKIHTMFTKKEQYSEEEAKRLIGQCGNFSTAFGDLFEFSKNLDELENVWDAYTLVCAKNYEELKTKDFWTHSQKR